MEEDSSSKSSQDPQDSKRTVGEELFLVHLSRFNKEERSPADFDHTTPESNIKSERTLGEELWQVHCKRMEGVAMEEDFDQPLDASSAKLAVKASPKKHAGTIKHPRRIMALRNRNVRVRIDE